MEYRRLGQSGLKLSVLSLGSWVTFGNQIDEKRSCELVELAYDAGINFFDSAESYADGEAERILGRTFRHLNLARDSFCVSSKVFWGGSRPTQIGLSRKHIVDACDAARSRLGTDYIDIFYCHRPDPDTPLLETIQAMHDLITQGKILYWGTSEWSPWAIRKALKLARHNNLYPPVVEQAQYNLLCRFNLEVGLHPYTGRNGLGITSWSPLASGILTGKYTSGIPPKTRLGTPGFEWLNEKLKGPEGTETKRKVQLLLEISNDLGCTPAQLAIAWCVANPTVTSVILGASSCEQLSENIGSLEVVHRISSDVRRRLDRMSAINTKAFLKSWLKLMSMPARARWKAYRHFSA